MENPLGKPETAMIVMEYCEVLSDVRIDSFAFRITWHPIQKDSCILWFMDDRVDDSFEALGQFSHFEKRSIPDFIVRYSTSEDLRKEIDKRKFRRSVETLPRTFFDDIDKMPPAKREQVFRRLFNLDDAIGQKNLAAKWRIMAKKFHPDTGGDDRIMGIINAAYDFLRREVDS